jgi:tripeptide aminopeptidase
MKLGRIDAETTANVGVIDGGTATNIIPAECHIKCEARSRNPAKMEKQRDHMIQCFQEEADAAGITMDVQNENAYPAYELEMDSQVLTLGMAAAERIGLEPLLRVTGGGADANIFNANGVPTTVLGCGMTNIHRHDEYVRISDLVKSTQLVVSIAETAAAAAA